MQERRRPSAGAAPLDLCDALFDGVKVTFLHEDTGYWRLRFFAGCVGFLR